MIHRYYRCRECGLRFITRSSRDKHEDAKHSQPDEDAGDTSLPPKEPRVHPHRLNTTTGACVCGYDESDVLDHIIDERREYEDSGGSE